MKETDEDLVARLQEGRIAAFRVLYDRHRDAMQRLALGITGNRADAEDAVQDAFIMLFRKVSAFRGEAAFRTWFYRIVVNACLVLCRKRRITEELPEASSLVAPQQPPAENEAKQRLALALEELPLRQRTVFTLAVMQGLSLTEVAKILGVQAGTARYHLSMARETLRIKLGPVLGSRGSDGGEDKTLAKVRTTKE